MVAQLHDKTKVLILPALTNAIHNHANLSELIPAVLEKEKDKLKKDLKDVKETSAIFYGTARLGECRRIITHFLNLSRMSAKTR